ncbi:hypothetical protein BHE74_00049609 [Ensete ventricosum]|nr:hypothetical protein BHE74_00049609 [Ensete ventricosum]
MPKAHWYWTKKPRAFHWGPSHKSFSSPGSTGIGVVEYSNPSIPPPPGLSMGAIPPPPTSAGGASSFTVVPPPFLSRFSRRRDREERPFLAPATCAAPRLVRKGEEEGREGKDSWCRAAKTPVAPVVLEIKERDIVTGKEMSGNRLL